MGLINLFIIDHNFEPETPASQSKYQDPDFSLLSNKNLSEILPSSAAMSNPNGLQIQKSCHCFDQGRTLNDVLMRAAR